MAIVGDYVGFTNAFNVLSYCGLASQGMTLRVRIERMFRPTRRVDDLVNNANPSGREVLWRRQSYSRAVRIMAVSTGPPSWT